MKVFPLQKLDVIFIDSRRIETARIKSSRNSSMSLCPRQLEDPRPHKFIYCFSRWKHSQFKQYVSVLHYCHWWLFPVYFFLAKVELLGSTTLIPTATRLPFFVYPHLFSNVIWCADPKTAKVTSQCTA